MGVQPAGVGRLESTATGMLTVAIVGLLVLAAAGLVVIPSRASFAASAGPAPTGAAESVLWISPSNAEPSEEAVVVTTVPVRSGAAPARAQTTIPVRVTPPLTAAQGGGTGYGCPAAIAWLSAHAAPDFQFECPGYAFGHQAMTCRNRPGVCPGQSVIVIADPCPAAYMNEAWNSLLADHLVTGPVDPYGSCP